MWEEIQGCCFHEVGSFDRTGDVNGVEVGVEVNGVEVNGVEVNGVEVAVGHILLCLSLVGGSSPGTSMGHKSGSDGLLEHLL